MGFHVLLTDITLDHAQRISIDPGEAAAWGSRTKFIYDKKNLYNWAVKKRYRDDDTTKI